MGDCRSSQFIRDFSFSTVSLGLNGMDGKELSILDGVWNRGEVGKQFSEVILK